MYGNGWGHSASETDAIVQRDILINYQGIPCNHK